MLNGPWPSNRLKLLEHGFMITKENLGKINLPWNFISAKKNLSNSSGLIAEWTPYGAPGST
ncbi:hypothetical protein DAPPUDRAFT_257995 [Daphnia pulex]|uniref:Uncharacterized protein n=1 Tax=Daphnia pulex TaxID=6669 RepID=E9HEL5_DAPPU|nr:hypothetical protein DAPPUDRAFT_257995 [Daphnia pulex]|eukprot:EFX69776.1 hypothetical protein DAPPUDRAFT_257995 [Daphnia pulex]